MNDAPEGIEGLMLKRKDSPYLAGRPKGHWFKWKRDGAHGRLRADVCPARPRQALVLLFRLYVRRLDGEATGTLTGARRQGLFRLHRRGTGADRPLRAAEHHRALWPGARSVTPKLVLESGLRRRPGINTPQVRHRHALSPHRPHPLGQAGGGGRHARHAQER
jgi:hypothetical protein